MRSGYKKKCIFSLGKEWINLGKGLNGTELGAGISQRKDGIYCARYVNRLGKRKYIYDSNLRRIKQ